MTKLAFLLAFVLTTTIPDMKMLQTKVEGGDVQYQVTCLDSLGRAIDFKGERSSGHSVTSKLPITKCDIRKTGAGSLVLDFDLGQSGETKFKLGSKEFQKTVQFAYASQDRVMQGSGPASSLNETQMLEKQHMDPTRYERWRNASEQYNSHRPLPK